MPQGLLLKVLILVLVEDGLREVILQLADLQTFMCEKWPKFQKSHEKKYIFRLQKYNFFQLNNTFFLYFFSPQIHRIIAFRTYRYIHVAILICHFVKFAGLRKSFS